MVGCAIGKVRDRWKTEEGVPDIGSVHDDNASGN